MRGLTLVSDGRLVGAGNAVSFVDTATGALSPLVARSVYTTSGDIIGLPDGYLYGTVTGDDTLVRVDPTSGATTVVGNTGMAQIYDLGFDGGTPHGFTSGGQVTTMDSADGGTARTVRLRGAWWGATTNPVLWP